MQLVFVCSVETTHYKKWRYITLSEIPNGVVQITSTLLEFNRSIWIPATRRIFYHVVVIDEIEQVAL